MITPQQYNFRLFGLAFSTVVLGAMDSVLSSAYLPDIIRDLGNGDEGWVASWINFAFLAGGAIGGIGLSFLSDRIGRRAVMQLALLCYGLGSGLGALSGSWELLTLTRLLVGAGVGAALVVSAVMVAEAWHPRTRAVALGILSVAYPVGIVLSGVITASVKDWRTGFIMGASAVVLVLPLRWWIEESKEWSKSISSKQQARLADYRGVLISGILIYGAMLIGLWATFSWLPTWVQSLLGVDTSEGQSQRGLSMGLLGGGGLVGGVVSGFLSNRFGGKRVQGVCFLLCLLLSYFLFQRNTTFSTPVIAGIGLLGICFGISQGVLNEYIPELFPSALRAAATGLCFHIGRIFTAVAVFFVGVLVVWFGGYGNAIFAFSSVYVAGLAALYFVPASQSETNEVLDNDLT